MDFPQKRSKFEVGGNHEYEETDSILYTRGTSYSRRRIYQFTKDDFTFFKI